MCLCTPEIKTPFCGRPGCTWPSEPPLRLGEPIPVIRDTVLQKVLPNGERFEYLASDLGAIMVTLPVPQGPVDSRLIITAKDHPVVVRAVGMDAWHLQPGASVECKIKVLHYVPQKVGPPKALLIWARVE